MKQMTPARHFTRADEAECSRDRVDLINNTETIVFKSVAESYMTWRLTASGGLMVDPSKSDDQSSKSDQKRILRARKEKADLFRLLQVHVMYSCYC